MQNKFSKLLFLLLLITAGSVARAQNAEVSIKVVINKMFTGMKESDNNGCIVV